MQIPSSKPFWVASFRETSVCQRAKEAPSADRRGGAAERGKLGECRVGRTSLREVRTAARTDAALTPRRGAVEFRHAHAAHSTPMPMPTTWWVGRRDVAALLPTTNAPALGSALAVGGAHSGDPRTGLPGGLMSTLPSPLSPATTALAPHLALPKGRMQEGSSPCSGTRAWPSGRAPGVPPHRGPAATEAKLLKPQNIVEMLDAGSRDLGFAGGLGPRRALTSSGPRPCTRPGSGGRCCSGGAARRGRPAAPPPARGRL